MLEGSGRIAEHQIQVAEALMSNRLQRRMCTAIREVEPIGAGNSVELGRRFGQPSEGRVDISEQEPTVVVQEAVLGSPGSLQMIQARLGPALLECQDRSRVLVDGRRLKIGQRRYGVHPHKELTRLFRFASQGYSRWQTGLAPCVRSEAPR